MNAAGRKKIASILSGIHTVCGRAEDGKLDASEFHIEELAKLIDGWESTIADMQAEEAEKYENLSEGLQTSERGEKLQEAADQLGDTLTALHYANWGVRYPPEADWQNDLFDNLQVAVEYLEQVE